VNTFLNLRRCFAVAVLLLAAVACYGMPFYDEPVGLGDWTGSRWAPPSNGLYGSGSYSDLGIAWDITQINSIFHYTYTFSNLNEKKLSHVILDLSDNCTSAASGCVYNVSGSTSLVYGTFDGSNAEPGWPTPATITGIKFEDLPEGLTSISFDSGRAPVWGDFYLKDGTSENGQVWNYAYNVGLIDHSSGSVTDFIARPDTTDGTIPEPASWMLVSGGLLLAAGAWLRRRP
jgi:hypothetical protein